MLLCMEHYPLPDEVVLCELPMGHGGDHEGRDGLHRRLFWGPDTDREEVIRRCAAVARSQASFWSNERAMRGDYPVIAAMSECERVAQAIEALED